MTPKAGLPYVLPKVWEGGTEGRRMDLSGGQLWKRRVLGFHPDAQPPQLKLKRSPLWGLPRTAQPVVCFPQRWGSSLPPPHVFESSSGTRCLMKASNLHVLMKTFNLLHISGRRESSWSFRRRPDGHQVPKSLRRTPILELLAQESFSSTHSWLIGKPSPPFTQIDVLFLMEYTTTL